MATPTEPSAEPSPGATPAGAAAGAPAAGAFPSSQHRSDWVRIRTLIRLRWIAVAGQVAALAVAELWLDIDARLGPTSVLIAASALLNLALTAVYPANARVTARHWTAALLYDVTVLMGLVALTGGLSNPFALLVLAPVTVAALALHLRPALLVAGLAAALTLLVLRVHLPLRLHAGAELAVPPLLQLGMAAAILTGIAFMAAYARSVSQEINTMSEALLAARLALAREQKLTDLAGVVAAAAHELGTPLATIKLASAELVDELSDRPDLAEDARLIRSQADRCRDILRSMGRAGKRDSFVARVPLPELLREAAEPHLDRGKQVLFLAPDAPPPMLQRSPELVHALRNLIQNAVDFAASRVWIESDWRQGELQLRILDDGPGFPPGLVARLGDPFLSGRERSEAEQQRNRRPGYEGMGMGLFIAKTLLQRTGATLEFVNHRRPECGGGGALVCLRWPLAALAAAPGAAAENRRIVD